MAYAKFGPGGNGDWFYEDKMKSVLQAPGWLASKHLDAYEYEATRGVNAGEAVLRALGEKADEHGIHMSLHTPYYISLSSVEEEKRLKSVSDSLFQHLFFVGHPVRIRTCLNKTSLKSDNT